MAEKEKIVTINLRKIFEKPATKRANSAIYTLKKAVRKETKNDNIKISNGVNEALWARGLFKGIRKIKVRIIDGKEVRVYLPDEKIEIKEEKKNKGKKSKIEEKIDEMKKKTETPKEEKENAEKGTVETKKYSEEKKTEDKKTEKSENTASNPPDEIGEEKK